MACDKFGYHDGAPGFDPSLPVANAGTHIGFFLDWAVRRGLARDRVVAFSGLGGRLLQWRLISGRTYLIWFSDYAFVSQDLLDEEGHAFAEAFYDGYLGEYDRLFQGRHASIYHVPYSRANRAEVAALLDQRLEAWRSAGRPAKLGGSES
jgi:hypothetical protein